MGDLPFADAASSAAYWPFADPVYPDFWDSRFLTDSERAAERLQYLSIANDAYQRDRD